MKKISTLIGLFFSAFLLFFAGSDAAFAQESANADDWVAVENWQAESRQYKAWGWGLFGSGAAMLGTGIALAYAEHGNTDMALAAASLAVVGGAFMVAGSGTLIAESVKFDPFRYTEPWQKESAKYHHWGWGLFGAGLAVTAAGIWLGAEAAEDEIQAVGWTVAGIGGAALLTGIGLLVANAVKFGDRGQGGSSVGFRWKPEVYVSPAMTGLGFSGTF